MIRLHNVSKVYNKSTHALKDVTVQIGDGEFVFLIGPSGAGKTTLLRLLIRDLLPTAGDVHVGEWHLNTLPNTKIHLLRRYVGTVFQDLKLLMDRTVYENIALGLEILGKPEQEITRDVKDVLELVGLGGKSGQFPLQMSAGELQRVAIARAIVGGPKILLADEPTGNLDPRTTLEILEILQQVNKIGTTVIMATHNETVVNDMKKRTLTIEDGILSSDELRGKYHIQAKKKHSTHEKTPDHIHEKTEHIHTTDHKRHSDQVHKENDQPKE